MSDIICVTNRKLCSEDFLVRLEKIAAAAPKAVILREHDLSAGDYTDLAIKAAEICGKYGVPLIPHRHFIPGIDYVQLKMEALEECADMIGFRYTGVSVHSPEEAVRAEEKGASFLIAGHIFPTDCKKDLPPRGLEYLKDVCRAVSIPVFGIGGIAPENYQDVRETGASGACVMSALMTCYDPAEYLARF